MNNYIAIFKADVKNTRRDPTLLIMLWIPLLMLAVIRWGIPALAEILPLVQEYYMHILAFLAVLNAIFPGFILSFIILDEKDLQLLPVIKVTPVSLSGFMYVRIGVLVVYGFISSLLIILFNGVISVAIPKALALSFLCALNAPILILIISTLAKNKIEGLTYLKAANIVLFIPALAMFVDSFWENLLAFFPAFWAYQFMDTGNYVYFGIGTIVLIGLNYLAFKFAIKRLN
ncbi:MAG: hypothetical protein PF517_08250 [Salinivirgaceae bacterium]|jgi:fluoroquinolone transport system permease protein|nr:hypothetical protein [Salinivirgaceae bacterium]